MSLRGRIVRDMLLFYEIKNDLGKVTKITWENCAV